MVQRHSWVARPFEVQRDRYLFHAKFADYDTAVRVHEGRYREFVQRGSGSSATWRLRTDELKERYTTWTRQATATNPAVNLDTLDRSSVVRQLSNGAYAARGGQLKAMDSLPLLRLPDYIGTPV